MSHRLPRGLPARELHGAVLCDDDDTAGTAADVDLAEAAAAVSAQKDRLYIVFFLHTSFVSAAVNQEVKQCVHETCE